MVHAANLDVCFIAGTLGQGGAERQLYYMLRALKGDHVRIRLLSLTRGEYWEAPIRELGIPVEWVGQRSSRLWRVQRIMSALRRDPPDVIQSQHFFTNLYAVVAARLLGSREIGAIRCDGKSEVEARGAILGRLSLRTPRLLAANSRTAIDYAIRQGLESDRLRFLPNVVDPTTFEPREVSSDAILRIAVVGRLYRQKRVDLFLEVIARLVAEAPGGIQATIAGDGPERSKLEQQAHAMQLLPGVVDFAGHQEDPREIYRRADLLLLTSDWEGTPNVILEAMASGLPVVSTAVGGVPDLVVDGRTGFLAHAGDVKTLVNHCLRLLNDTDLRAELGRRGREHILAHHAPAALRDNLQAIYTAAMA